MMLMRLAIVAGLLALSGPALAAKANLPLDHESLQDHARCDALAQQFDHAAAQRPVTDAAKEQASQGAVLCRAGRYGEGADTLEKAVRMIGEAPAK
jgi:hypothetical protein